ncbi:YitT family protein [Bacillus sp. TH22]|uniref:YitT family protein n=1 Tax=unclassified Bacillus (in: firmicutes) TaxID=185979 RepID=UPI0019132BC9|nr:MULTISPECIES: YitT family protein [unclassified Bacillus (in: firmicutes)]MBK5448536.1 YitT family protein [Bacillus sp. TH22]MBK5457523.1 YitT family protein [Bacillus sp. TH23]
MTSNLKIRNIIFILIGSAIFSFGIVNINIENHLAEGGFTGITLLLYFKFSLDPSYTNLILNVPLFFIGWKLLGRTTFLYTLIGTFSVSLFLWVFQRYEVLNLHLNLQNDMTLAALFAGAFIGIGLGIIFKYGGTTGGVDIIARLAHKYVGWSMGKTMFIFDAVVIIISILTYLSYREGMYTLVAVFIGAKVIDFMQEGAYAAKGATIISDKNDEIASKILSEMERGATFLKAVGSYTKIERNVLYCVVAKNEIVKLKNIIISVDPHAFVAVSDVHDVVGEGFTLDENKKPLHN